MAETDLMKPTEKDIRKAVKASVVWAILHIIYTASMFAFKIDNENGMTFIIDVIGGYYRLNNIFVLLRLGCLLLWAVICAVTLIYIVKALIAKKIYVAENINEKIGFSHFSTVLTLLGMGRGLFWILYILVTVWSLGDGTMEYLYQDINLTVYIVMSLAVTVIGGRIVSHKSKVTNKYFLDKFNMEMKEEEEKSREEKGLREFESMSAHEKAESFDILIQYKKLYDDGAITEEEYEKKKSELLK